MIKLFETADVTIAACIAVLGALIALLQIKANIISSARINWTIKIRELTAELRSLSLELQQRAFLFRDNKVKGKSEQEVSQLLWDFKEETIDRVIKIDQKCREIILHLNPVEKRNKDQREFQKLIESWSDSIDTMKIISGEAWKKNDVDSLQNEARFVIKKAWDDSKTFKLREF
jgi:hypothetical protein